MNGANGYKWSYDDNLFEILFYLIIENKIVCLLKRLLIILKHSVVFKIGVIYRKYSCYSIHENELLELMVARLIAKLHTPLFIGKE